MAQKWTLFPITLPKHYAMYKQACASFWVAEEVDVTKDGKDLEELKQPEKDMLFRVLSFFAASDAIVSENLVAQFFGEIEDQEVRQFYAIQIGVEAVHSEMYSILIDTYVKDADTRAGLFAGVENSATIKAKADFCRKYTSRDIGLNKRLVAYACVEGILFSASFAVIYFFKKRGVLHGLTSANEFIARDEGLHATFSCLVYKTHTEPLPEEEVVEVVREAVLAEHAFVDECIPATIYGLSAERLKVYVEFIADRLLVELGFSKLYHVQNPLEYMDMQSLATKSNFFETRVSEYRKGLAMCEIRFDEDF